jgi:hypothetical protein
MKRLFVQSATALVLLIFFSISAIQAQAVNPDSGAYKKCMAECRAGDNKTASMASYLGMSCEGYCDSFAADELATLDVTVKDQQSLEEISAVVDIKGPDGYWRRSQDGHFIELKAGTYTIEARLVNFRPRTIKIPVDPRKKKKYTVEIRLIPKKNRTAEPKRAEPEKDCPEKFCHGDTLHYNGHFDPDSGRCVSNTWKCPRGCDAAAGRCVQSQLAFQRLVFNTPGKGLVLNGRSRIQLSGRAIYDNPAGESLAGQQIPMEGVVLSTRGERPPRVIGVRVFNAWVQPDGSVSCRVKSEDPIRPEINLKGVRLEVRVKGHPEMKTAVELVSPAPRIKRAGLKSRPQMWQESYGVFSVVAADADKNIVSYTIRAPHGTLRVDQLDWEGLKKKTLYTYGWKNPERFEFGWMAPAVSEHLKLDLLRDLRTEWMAAAKEAAKTSLNELGAQTAKLGLGKKEGALIDPGAFEDMVAAARRGDVQGLDYQILKYGLSKHETLPVLESYLSAVEDGYSLFGEVQEHTGRQAAEMGRAYESGHEFYKQEMAARLFSIALDGVKLHDGVYSFAETMAGDQDESLGAKLKDIAINATIGSLQKGAEYVADTYKSAGARIRSLPFFLDVMVTDKDGYRGSHKIIVEVSGYESLMQ